MPLYVVPVDTPAAGVDWQAVVPGQYLWNVTGITATLATGGAATVAVDSSGNGLDGSYGYSLGYPISVPGLVPGDLAKQFADPAVPFTTPGTVSIPTIPFDMSSVFTVEWWMDAATVGWNGPVITFFGAPSGLRVRIGGDSTGVGFGVLRDDGVNSDGDAWDISAFMDGQPHYYVVAFDNTDFFLWVDGVLQTPTLVLPLFFAPTGDTWSAITCDDGINTGINATLDELAVYGSTFDQSDVDAHLGAAGDITTYTAQVLASGPSNYYHLDDVGPGTARQVDLIVTDGTRTVLEIPTGFAPPAGGGPWAYSWSPTLASSSQPTAGTPIAIATPRLVLPAGYTIGTRTLDLGASDQWSDVIVWWDSNLQDAAAEVNLFAYPPGARLVYHQEQPPL